MIWFRNWWFYCKPMFIYSNFFFYFWFIKLIFATEPIYIFKKKKHKMHVSWRTGLFRKMKSRCLCFCKNHTFSYNKSNWNKNWTVLPQSCLSWMFMMGLGWLHKLKLGKGGEYLYCSSRIVNSAFLKNPCLFIVNNIGCLRCCIGIKFLWY